MNIDDYRALKEAERNQKDQPPVPEAQPEADVKTPESTPADTPPEKEDSKPIEVEIDGQKVNIDELKNGYLRQSDYTKKTQEIARKRKELEEAETLYRQLKANPELAHQAGAPQLDPLAQRIRELEEKLYDMKVEGEVARLQSQYKDFDVRQVLTVAHEKRLNNLDDAYKLWKASQANEPLDVEKLKAQIRKEVEQELNASKDTGSIISSQKSEPVVENKGPTYTQTEARVAAGMGLTPQEYVKWRDMQKPK